MKDTHRFEETRDTFFKINQDFGESSSSRAALQASVRKREEPHSMGWVTDLKSMEIEHAWGLESLGYLSNGFSLKQSFEIVPVGYHVLRTAFSKATYTLAREERFKPFFKKECVYQISFPAHCPKCGSLVALQQKSYVIDFDHYGNPLKNKNFFGIDWHYTNHPLICSPTVTLNSHRLYELEAAIIKKAVPEIYKTVAQKFTPTELDVCEYHNAGLTTNGIALKMKVSPDSIYEHNQNILAKGKSWWGGFRDAAEVARYMRMLQIV